jgi:hypothetical protein
MRHKELVTTKLERLNDELSGLLSLLTYSKSILEVKNRIFEIKEHISDIQTLINSEGNEWR